MDFEVENQNTSSSTSSTPDVSPPENHEDDPASHPPRLGTIIPNRIFVGGIDCKADEDELRHFFSRYGAVKDVKIIIDRSGIPKGYGFVSFETKEDVLKILNDAGELYFKDKRLSVGQAVRKHQSKNKSVRVSVPDSATPLPMSHLPLCHAVSPGCPYTHHSRGPFVHCHSMNLPSHHWPRFAPPVMFPVPHQQPVYQPAACHCYQCVQSPYQFGVVQSFCPSAPVLYSQPSPYRKPADGGFVQLSPPVAEDATPENQMVAPSDVHQKPKSRQNTDDHDCNDPAEAAETPDESSPQTPQAST